MDIFKLNIDRKKYFIVTYRLGATTNLKEAAWQLAIGQSVGNPNVRNKWETDELFDNHSCIILDTKQNLIQEKEGIVKIAFPVINIDFAIQ